MIFLLFTNYFFFVNHDEERHCHYHDDHSHYCDQVIFKVFVCINVIVDEINYNNKINEKHLSLKN